MQPDSVLHVVRASPGGVPNVAASLIADQRRRGWRVAVACSPELWLAAHAQAAGARFVPWRAQRGPGAGLGLEAARLGAICARIDPQLVHLHSSKAGLAGRAAIQGRRATVFQPHAWSFEAAGGPSRQMAVAWERLASRWSDAIVCVSDDERRRGEQAGVRGRWAVIENGIDLARHRPASDGDRAAARRALALSDGPIVVLAGRLGEQKGQDVMLDAWPAVLREVPEAELVLVGDGPSRRDLEARAGPRVRFAGWSEDVRPWIAAADVVAMPSRWEAGLALVAMEAMALGRSLVAGAVAGTGVIDEHGCGAVVPMGAPGALATALAQRLRDRRLADREGAAGRALVERRFRLDAATERMSDLYGQVLRRRATGRPTARRPQSPAG